MTQYVLRNEAQTTKNVAQLLQVKAREHPNKIALIFENQGQPNQITFGQLWAESGSVAAGLTKADLRYGHRVIVMIPMSVDLYVVLLALIRVGAVAVFVDPWISRLQIANFADFAEPQGFIGVGKSHFLRILHRRLRNLPITVTTDKKWFHWPASLSLTALKRNEPSDVLTAVNEDDSALITFTSGASGEPKGANRTHRFLKAQHRALSCEFPYRVSDIDLTMFPVFALNNLATGLTTVIPEIDFTSVATTNGKRIFEQISEHQVTTMTASPLLFDRLADYLIDQEALPAPLRRILTGGAPVQDCQLSRWKKAFPNVEIIVAYGSTEAEPVAHITADERLGLPNPRRGFCAGRLIDSISGELIPIQKSPPAIPKAFLNSCFVRPDEIGELVVKGEHVCRDYFNNPRATSNNKLPDASGNIWHRMGDTGYFDSQKRFWLTGRVHSTIRIASQMIHPQVVEQRARSVSETVIQVAAIPFTTPRGSTGLGLVIFSPEARRNVERRNLALQVRRQLQEIQINCDSICFSDRSLPVDPRHNSKLDYDAIRKSFNRKLKR